MTSDRRQQIVESLQDKQYRDDFVAEFINTGVAFQIHETREARGWTQDDLGQRAGIAQERISLYENPDYGKLTLTTLKRLASAFDAALVVRFAPFSELVNWVTGLSARDVAVPSFGDERFGDEPSPSQDAQLPHTMATPQASVPTPQSLAQHANIPTGAFTRGSLGTGSFMIPSANPLAGRRAAAPNQRFASSAPRNPTMAIRSA